MRRLRRNSGFTMMELLAVVAILGILAGVAFVAVQNHQRSMARLEDDAIAKEIFVAAQNHLTMARNENYYGLGEDEYGSLGTDEKDKDKDGNSKGVYYIACNNGTAMPGEAEDMLFSVMLPLGSIDEVVRRGNYLIRYQPQYGLVLDVFYAKPTGQDNRFGMDSLDSEYTALMGSNQAGRTRYGADKKVIGWYGSKDLVGVESESATGTMYTDLMALKKAQYELKKPVLTVKNGDRLVVEVDDTNDTNDTSASGYQLKLLITGETSGTQRVIQLCGGTPDATGRVSSVAGTGIYKVILDDITSPGKHFADFYVDTGADNFINGENITVQAVAFNNTVLSNIGYSDVEMTNSLFEKLDVTTTTDSEGNTTIDKSVASINNIRHLENLDATVSALGYTALKVNEADQTTDLDWEAFKGGADVTKVGGKVQIYDNAKNAATEIDCFKPVNPTYKITYDGKGHNIFSLVVNHPGAAGLFGELTVADSEVKNLALVNATITNTAPSNAGGTPGTSTTPTTSAAGALVGVISAKSTVTNVVAFNTPEFEQNLKNDSTKTLTTINAGSGDAGGLIGTVTAAECTINKCAAALVVESTGGNAGGLIGSMSVGTVTACYSGGHTDHGAYYEYDTANGKHKLGSPIYNIRAEAGIAGGLIGVAGTAGDDKTTVEACYSTCSVTGKTAGGFVGTFEGNSITKCYATGLVCGTEDDTPMPDSENNEITVTRPKDGAFAYSVTATTVSGCNYFEIINERRRRDSVSGSAKTATVYATIPTTGDASKDSYVYLSALGEDGKKVGISALDANATDYDAFVGAPEDATTDPATVLWNAAVPYDGQLRTFYSLYTSKTVKDSEGNDKTVQEGLSKFNLKGIPRLDTSTDYTTAQYKDYFVTRHYGDWPAPEIFVFNTKTTP